MNNGTYEGILNQDDLQEYVNGDNAIPFYPERAETVIRTDTAIAALQKENAELRAELERAIHRAEVNHQSLNKALEASKSKDKIIFALNEKVKSLRADNRSMLILKIGIRASRLHDLFMRANAAKRQMRRERDAAHQSRNRIVWLVRRYCALNRMNLSFFLDSEKLLRNARIDLDAANAAKVQAEAERDAAHKFRAMFAEWILQQPEAVQWSAAMACGAEYVHAMNGKRDTP